MKKLCSLITYEVQAQLEDLIPPSHKPRDTISSLDEGVGVELFRQTRKVLRRIYGEWPPALL